MNCVKEKINYAVKSSILFSDFQRKQINNNQIWKGQHTLNLTNKMKPKNNINNTTKSSVFFCLLREIKQCKEQAKKKKKRVERADAP